MVRAFVERCLPEMIRTAQLRCFRSDFPELLNFGMGEDHSLSFSTEERSDCKKSMPYRDSMIHMRLS